MSLSREQAVPFHHWPHLGIAVNGSLVPPLLSSLIVFLVLLPVVPHEAAAEVSKKGNLRRLVAVNGGSQSETTDGPTSGWRPRRVIEVVVVIVV